MERYVFGLHVLQRGGFGLHVLQRPGFEGQVRATAPNRVTEEGFEGIL